MNNEEMTSENGIAIIGMSGQFPGADTIEKFWENLCNGIESISTFSESELVSTGVPSKIYKNQDYVNSRGILEGIEFFDADFFDINPKEAQIIDPQHRLFLESCWNALEDAGYCSNTFAGSIGVYGGMGSTSYFLNNLHTNKNLLEEMGEYLIHIGNEKDFLTTRVSYKLNLRGPSLNIQSACSTSLVAICNACNHLLTYQCDMALAGGVAIIVPQKSGYIYQEGLIFSPDGKCRPFDARADGTVSSNGVGVVLLKRLEDAIKDRDNIYAIIKSYGINNDGFGKIGYSAPSVKGQADAVQSALSMGDVDPESITYIEAHGTGTILGDPIEIKALTQTFELHTEKKNFCAIGSVKGNVGHLIEAAGVAGLIKATLAVNNKKIPPTINFESPNPNIDFSNTPFFINTELKNWETNQLPRRACVNSLGIGGTNAFVILEEKPKLKPRVGDERPFHLLPLSAKTKSSLGKMCANLIEFLDKKPDTLLEDLAFTLQVGRKMFDHKQAVICEDIEDAKIMLAQSASESEKDLLREQSPNITFRFSGIGSPYLNMGLELYQLESVYRKTIDEFSFIYKQAEGVDLRNILFPEQEHYVKAKELLNQKSISYAIAFMTQYALAKLWQEWGVQPASLIGYNIGELVAACISGVFTLQEGLTLLLLKSKEDSTEETAFVYGRASQAYKTTASQKLISKDSEKINQIKFKAPSIPFISSLSSTWIKPDEAISSEYWLKQIKYSENHDSESISPNIKNIHIEVGPDNSNNDSPYVLQSLGNYIAEKGDYQTLLESLGSLWMMNIKIDWEKFNKNRESRRIPLPTYPFEKKRYWIDPPSLSTTILQDPLLINNIEKSDKILSIDEIETILIKIWQEFFELNSVRIDSDFYKLGGDSVLALQVIAKIQATFKIKLKPSSLLEYPTISDLAKNIHQKISKDSNTSFNFPEQFCIKLRSGKSKNPLFFIHPIDGQILCYKALSDSIEYDASIYGIQAPEIEIVKSVSLETIEEIASFYIKAIQQIQPMGPYDILGHSFGGLIAYEIASQLVGLGHSIASLTLIDIKRPDFSLETNTENTMMINLLELFEGKTISDLEALPVDEQMDILIKSMGLEQLSLQEQRRIYERIKLHWNALINYHPKTYLGKVLFIEAKEKFIQKGSLALTWKELIKGSIQVYEVPGNHLTMFKPQNIKSIATIIDSYLKEDADGKK